MIRRLARDLALAALAIALLALPAQAARHRNHVEPGSPVTQFCGDRVCSSAAISSQKPIKHSRRAAARHLAPADANGNAGASTSRACLTAETRGVLEAAEAHFATRFVLVSTCRPGAFIAGTDHPSEHRYGKAVDLLVPRAIAKRAVVSWFYGHARGVTMIYARLPHVHFDTGPYHTLACGGCGGPSRHARRTHLAHIQ